MTTLESIKNALSTNAINILTPEESIVIKGGKRRKCGSKRSGKSSRRSLGKSFKIRRYFCMPTPPPCLMPVAPPVFDTNS